jgi:hypothetical protein
VHNPFIGINQPDEARRFTAPATPSTAAGPR